jgi:DNA-binding transcriptional ArsR family regulator
MLPRSPDAAEWQAHAPVFAALGDETRLSLVMRLGQGELCSISQLTQGTGLTRQAVTKHLRVLQSAGLVRGLRSGRESRFEFDPQPMEEMRRYLDRVSREWDRRLTRLRSLVEDGGASLEEKKSMAADEEILTTVYRDFNARDIDSILKFMAADVDWPNGMTGGRVHGQAEVRDYWTNQWLEVDPRVEPKGFRREADGRVAVNVHQVVRELDGRLLMDRMVEHVYAIDGGLIQSMEIRELASE